MGVEGLMNRNNGPIGPAVVFGKNVATVGVASGLRTHATPSDVPDAIEPLMREVAALG